MRRIADKFLTDLSRRISLLGIIILIGGLAGATFAQDVNDDLKPEKKVVKKKVVKTVSTKKTTKTVRRATPKAVKKKTVVRTKSRVKPKSVRRVTPKKATAVKNAEPLETSDEILERYMDYEQSLTVVPKDWDRVVTLSNGKLKEFKSDAQAKAQLSFAMGQLSLSRRDFPGALLHFNASAKTLSNSALPYYGLGLAYLETKKIDEAEQSFKKATELKSDFALAYKGLGVVMQARGKEKKAQKYFEQAGAMGFKEAEKTEQQPESNPE